MSGVLLAISVLMTAAAAQGQEITIRLGYFPNITHVQALVARNFERRGHGWFPGRLGPDVKIAWYAYNAGPSAMEAIFAESLDLTYVGPSPAINAYARSRSEEIRVVAGAVMGGSALVVQPDAGLIRPSDFRGKRVGTPQFGNTQDIAARAWLMTGGLQVTQTGGDVQVIPTANPDQLALFKSGQLDAVWTVEPWVSRLELEAQGKILIEDKEAITTILVSRAAFLAAHPDIVRRFVSAHRELTEWIIEHPKEAQDMARDELQAQFRTAIAPELVAHSWSRMTLTVDVSLDRFQAFIASAQRLGFLPSMPDLSHFIAVP